MLELNDRLAALAGHTQALIAVYDPVGRVAYANAAFREAFFLELDENPLWIDLMRRNHQAGRGPRVSHPNFERWLSSCLSRRGTRPSVVMEADLSDGRWLSITESTMADGWMLFVACDTTLQRQESRELRQQRDIAWKYAYTDDLTGISNRRHILDVLSALLARPVVGNQPIGCVGLLDVDAFKQINDRFGHSAGDLVLVEIARRVPTVLRTCDAFGRLGGEEFMVILPHITLTQGKLVMARVLDTFRHSSLVASHPAHAVTCSAGLTEIDPQDRLEDLYSRADQALYEAKHAGRDRTVCCERLHARDPASGACA